MIINKRFVNFSIYLIQQIWQGKSGSNFKKKFGIKCRFVPSCSNYTILTLKKYGFWIGWYKGYKRILRCTPDTPYGTIDYP